MKKKSTTTTLLKSRRAPSPNFRKKRAKNQAPRSPMASQCDINTRRSAWRLSKRTKVMRMIRSKKPLIGSAVCKSRTTIDALATSKRSTKLRTTSAHPYKVQICTTASAIKPWILATPQFSASRRTRTTRSLETTNKRRKRTPLGVRKEIFLAETPASATHRWSMLTGRCLVPFRSPVSSRDLLFS